VNQARRQDLAAGGGQKPDGEAKNQKGGPHFENTALDVWSNQGPNVKWGITDFKWGAGHHWPPAGDGPDVNSDHPRTLVKKAQRNQLGFFVH